MSNNESLFDLWNLMELSKKKHLMQQFRKIHGNHYTKRDFHKFLAERHNDLNRSMSHLIVK